MKVIFFDERDPYNVIMTGEDKEKYREQLEREDHTGQKIRALWKNLKDTILNFQIK